MGLLIYTPALWFLWAYLGWLVVLSVILWLVVKFVPSRRRPPALPPGSTGESPVGEQKGGEI